MQEITIDKKVAVVKKIFKEDVVAFSKFFYPHYCKKETPEFHRRLFDIYKNGGKRIAIAAPRGHGKSTVTDLFYLSHEILHNDKVNFVLIVSDTYTQSAMFLNTIKTEFETNDKLKAFYNIEIERSSVNEIVVNGKLIKAIGANQKVRGLLWRENRPNLIIVDDLENDELVRSKERRYNLSNWFNASLVPSLSDNGRIIMIGTVLHYDSLLENILGGEQYKEFETKRFKAIMDNKPLWGDLWSIEKLEELKNSYIAKGKGFLYYQEYMNEPVSDENRKFKVEKLKYYEDNALENKMIVNYCCIDRAYSLDKTADFTGIVVVGVDRENNWFVRHAERFKGLESDLITKIFDLKKYYNLENIGIEQKAFEYTIKPALEQRMRETNNFFSVQPLRDLGQSKGLRIEGLLPRYEMGTIFFKREQYDLIDELITYPFARNDDLSDALSYCLTIAEYKKERKQFIPKY